MTGQLYSAIFTTTDFPEYISINYDCGGRLYDPVIGRFFSPDNFVQAPDFTQSFNRYSYCLNNPLSYTDPTGENFITDYLYTLSNIISISARVITEGISYVNDKINGVERPTENGNWVLVSKGQAPTYKASVPKSRGGTSGRNSERESGNSDISGGSMSVGGVFCPGVGLFFNVGIAWDKTGEILPFLSVGRAVGVELGIGTSYSHLSNGLNGFDKPTDILSASAGYLSGSYTLEAGPGIGISVGLMAGISIRKAATIKGSWDYYGYEKFGHPYK